MPLDGSELAECALPCAQKLAVAGGATLHLVRAVEPPTAITAAGVAAPVKVYDEIIAAEWQEATAYLERVRACLETERQPVHVARLDGYAAAALLEYERAAAIDLVVLCSHGRSGRARFALGSVAERLLRHGAAPVLLVRAYGPPAAYGQVVVPLDGSARAEEALRVVAQLSRAVVHSVTLLRVVHGQEEGQAAERYLKDAVRRLQRDGVVLGGEAGCTCVVRQGDVAQAIIAVAGVDKLVVMATHGRDALGARIGGEPCRAGRSGGRPVSARRGGRVGDTALRGADRAVEGPARQVTIGDDDG